MNFLKLLNILTFTLILQSCAHQSGSYVKRNGKWVFQEKRVGLNYINKDLNRVDSSQYSYSSEGSYLWPVPSSKKITSHFGKRGRRHHDGIDIAARRGSHIVASADGKVSFVGRMRGYGNTVVIKHSNGHHTVYAHNQKNFVKKNQRVSQGEVIAKIGSTGRSTGPHLHFEIRKNNKVRNPASYLGRVKRHLARN